MQTERRGAHPLWHDLALVTAGLELDGGGRAVVGRLLVGAAAAHAEERRIGFEVLSLGRTNPLDAALRVRCFGGHRAALAWGVARRQLARRRLALLYDLLGPARVQPLLPRGLRGRYGVLLLGIEVFRPLCGLRRRALRLADLRLAISGYTRERARGAMPREAEAAAVLHLTLEERPAAGAVDAGLVAGLGEGFLLTVGRMSASERYKGHDQLLQALCQLRRSLPSARLVVVGEGDDRGRIEARAASLGVADRVAFTGFVSEATLVELYRRAAAFVMVSRGEGFGLVYLEAMRAGRPVVAARGSAAEEIVVPGQTGLLVDPAEPPELAAALRALLAQPDLARRLGAGGERRYASAFAPDLFRRRLSDHLDLLTGSSGEAPANA